MDLAERQKKLQDVVGYYFKDLSILEELLTHKSYANEKNTAPGLPNYHVKDNERLEFLGDSVIEMLVTQYIVNSFPSYREGELSKIRGYVVSRAVLAGLAEELDLGSYLFLAKGEEKSGGRSKPSILANSFEALVGGIFLDGDIEAARVFLLGRISEKIEFVAENKSFNNSKSALQEYTQAKLSCMPKYIVSCKSGPEHEKLFEVTLEVNKEVLGRGVGKTRKDAEQMAAKLAIERLNLSSQ